MGITCSKSDFDLLRFAWFNGGEKFNTHYIRFLSYIF